MISWFLLVARLSSFGISLLLLFQVSIVVCLDFFFSPTPSDEYNLEYRGRITFAVAFVFT
jgi:hypothetical protein